MNAKDGLDRLFAGAQMVPRGDFLASGVALFAAASAGEALTIVVMQRYWMCSQIRRTLGSKIKGFNELMNQPLEAA